jgi:hypothetical protein
VLIEESSTAGLESKRWVLLQIFEWTFNLLATVACVVEVLEVRD